MGEVGSELAQPSLILFSNVFRLPFAVHHKLGFAGIVRLASRATTPRQNTVWVVAGSIPTNNRFTSAMAWRGRRLVCQLIRHAAAFGNSENRA